MEKLCDTCLYGIRVEDNKLGCTYAGICHTPDGEKTAWAMRDTMHLINDDAMKSISSRRRTIEEQWEVMCKLQRRGLVSTEDLEAVLKDVMHLVRMRFNTTENKH